MCTKVQIILIVLHYKFVKVDKALARDFFKIIFNVKCLNVKCLVFYVKKKIAIRLRIQ